MKKKNIIIGGGAGYIGSALVPVLLKEGHKVTVVDLLWFGNYLPKGVRLMRKDLLKVNHTELKEYDCFIFLAGVSNDPMAHFNPRLNFQYNAALPAYLAFEAKKAGIKRYIYGSSCSIYGNTVRLCKESDLPGTVEPYGISKLQGEVGVMQNQSKDFSTIVLRQGTVCGYSPRMRFDLVVNAMIKSAIMEGKIIVNNAQIWRPICSIQDAINAYMLSIDAPARINGIFNIASGNYQVGAIAKRVQFLLEKKLDKKINIVYKKEKILRNYKVSLAKSKTQLRYRPNTTLDLIVNDIIDNVPLSIHFSDKKYYNIETFKHISL